MKELKKMWWQFLDKHFNREELNSLCAGLGINHEDIGPRGKSAFIFEFVEYLFRRDMIPYELSQEIIAQRPELADKLPKMPIKSEEEPRARVNGKQVHFEQAIARNEIDLAISILRECLTKLSLPTQMLTTIESRWHKLKTANIENTLYEETSYIRMNKLRKSLLDLWAFYFKTNY